MQNSTTVVKAFACHPACRRLGKTWGRADLAISSGWNSDEGGGGGGCPRAQPVGAGKQISDTVEWSASIPRLQCMRGSVIQSA
jgi:hypothetical protein